VTIPPPPPQQPTPTPPPQQTHTHKNGTRVERGIMFFRPPTPIPLEAGCYVDGGTRSSLGTIHAAVDLCFGLGAIDQVVYNTHKQTLFRLNDQLDKWYDAEDDWYELVTETLNACNISDSHFWQWEDGDLLYTVNLEDG
jgi:hypothetical protein